MRNKGITLIALVITIIILLILASVTIATLTGDNGLITKAMEAREKTEIGAIEEQLRLAQMSAKLKKQGGDITIEDLIEELENQGVDFEREEDRTLIIEGKYIYEFEEKNGEVAWENNGTMTTPKPKIVSIEILDKIESKIKVKVTVKRNGGGTLIYFIQEENGTYQEVTRTQTASGEQAQEEYTFTIDPDKIYSKIKVEAIAENKQTASKEIDVVSIPALTRSDIVFTYTVEGKTIKESDYTKGPVMVQITTKNVDTTGYKLQYTTGDPTVASNWIDYTTGIEFTNNSNLYVRLGDGRQGGKYATGRVENIDKLAPNTFRPTTTSTTNSITLTGSTSDAPATSENGSSGIKAYYFSKDKGATWEPTNGQTNTSYTFSGLIQNQTYSLKMKAVDKAGNETITDTITQATGEVPGLIETSIKLTPDKTTPTNGNVIVTIEKTGGEEYTIQYTTEEAPNNDTKWIDYKEGTEVTFEENGVIHARLWDGSNAGNYATANITNIDKTEPNKATIKVNQTGTAEGETIMVEVTVTQSDNTNGSGVDNTKCKWVVTTSNTEIGTDETKYTGGSFTSNPQTITFNQPDKEAHCYLHVLTIDNVGNKKETISDEIYISRPSSWTGEVNSPNLKREVTAVYWDASNNEKTLTSTSTQEEWNNWYDYQAGDNTTDTKTSKWANIKITKNGINSYFVWIPRYEYKILSGEGTSQTGKIDVKFIPTSQTIPDEGYKIHPAFQNGTSNNFKNGEWDAELPGIWIGKYEACHSDATANEAGSSTTLKVVPGVQSWRNTAIRNSYTTAYNYDRAKESHMMKNSEWGAVAYLTHSQYGRNGHQMDINNSSTFITGNGGGSIGASAADGVTNAYNTTKGMQASSTGNIYGIYDLSGGAWEGVAAYITNGNSNLSINGSSFAITTADPNGYQTKSTKYSTVYPYNSSSDVNTDNYTTYKNAKSTTYGYGDAVLETSASGSERTSWLGNYSFFPNANDPFFGRGGSYSSGDGAGVFFFSCTLGSAYGADSFRVVLSGM